MEVIMDRKKNNMSPWNSETDTNLSSITILVNREYGLPFNYIPEDLTMPNIPFSEIGFLEKKLMREEAAKALKNLFQAASKQGLDLIAVSGYRSYDRQRDIYFTNIIEKGFEHTNQYSAKPGHSEHQTGLAMDVSTPSINNELEQEFADTPEGKWIAQNAHHFGFILRYPKDKSHITGYSYEPWHLRYVGNPLATYLYNHNLTLEEYYHYVPNNT